MSPGNLAIAVGPPETGVVATSGAPGSTARRVVFNGTNTCWISAGAVAVYVGFTSACSAVAGTYYIALAPYESVDVCHYGSLQLHEIYLYMAAGDYDDVNIQAWSGGVPGAHTGVCVEPTQTIAGVPGTSSRLYTFEGFPVRPCVLANHSALQDVWVSVNGADDPQTGVFMYRVLAAGDVLDLSLGGLVSIETVLVYQLAGAMSMWIGGW